MVHSSVDSSACPLSREVWLSREITEKCAPHTSDESVAARGVPVAVRAARALSRQSRGHGVSSRREGSRLHT